MANQNPTYPLDRRILEIIMELTGTTREVKLDVEAKASGEVFDRISQQIADGAWKIVEDEYVNEERPRKYRPFHINTWKSVFGHNNLNAGMSPTEDTIMQLILFLDYDNWDELMDDLDNLYQCVVVEKQPVRKADDVSEQTPYSSFSHLRPGDELDVYWPKSSKYDMPGDACIKIRYMGTYGAPKFHINAVQNCSLEAGEDFDAHCLEEGKKIMLTNRQLHYRHKGNYVSGAAVTSINIFRKERY